MVIEIRCNRWKKRTLLKMDCVGIFDPLLAGKSLHIWCRHCKQAHPLDLYRLISSTNDIIYVDATPPQIIKREEHAL